MSANNLGNNEKKQPGAEEPDELNEARVDKFIAQETAKMKAGQSPVFPMSELIRMELERLKAAKKNKGKAKK
jgi:hypothetical protein